ncbi:MAG: hypothetical protein IPH76_07095 [Xanthomonadales bacterium]|nr:hypothetical protein [Xanthomonadales bacterium]
MQKNAQSEKQRLDGILGLVGDGVSASTRTASLLPRQSDGAAQISATTTRPRSSA